MKNQKNIIKIALFSLVLLSGCMQTPSSSSFSSSSEEEFVPVPATYRTGSFRLELANTLLREGTTFYDGTSPILYSGGRPYTQQVVYSINKDGVSFSAAEPLSIGRYTFKAKATLMSDSLKGTFEVKKSATALGKEGKGYYTISEEETLKTRLQNFTYVGALSEGKTPSIGSPKLLVIPLSFSDTSFSQKELNKIEKAYFGKDADTSWESLVSYYEKSSYGKLKFEGKVVAPYQYSLTSKEVEDRYLGKTLTVNDIVDSVVREVFKRDNLNRKDYDDNEDGYLDGVEIIYKSSREMTDSTKTLWWCFASSLHNEPKKENPIQNRYFWSLYSQIETPYYSDSIDAHTLVHETGHMLGLNDYYDYTSKTVPAGAVDMMDRNIGDHCAYSKYMLGWVTPKVVDGSASDFEITLSSFTDTGDCLILRNTTEDPFNNTPYDEYLMLSYITPSGVNEQDSHGYGEYNYAGYGNRGGYSKAGLQAMHIDNRLLSFEGSKVSENNEIDYSKAAYTDALNNEESIQIVDGNRILTSSPSFTMSSNTPTQSYGINSNGLFGVTPKIKEITAIPASKTLLFQGSNGTQAMGVQSNLFGTKEYDCGSTYFSNYDYRKLFNDDLVWNDGSKNNFNFQVLEQKDDSITLRILKNF